MTSIDSPPDAVRTEQHRLPAAFSAFMELPAAAPADRADVRQVLSLFGHAVDNNAWDEVVPLLAPDAALHAGGTIHSGREAVVGWFAERADPPSHHTVNTVVRGSGGRVVAWSRLVTIAGDGTVASADALDRLARTADGWQIVHRAIHPRHDGEHPGDDVVRAWLA